MARHIPDDFSATHRLANEGDLAQIELLDQRLEIVGQRIEIVTARRLGRAAVAAAI